MNNNSVLRGASFFMQKINDIIKTACYYGINAVQ